MMQDKFVTLSKFIDPFFKSDDSQLDEISLFWLVEDLMNVLFIERFN